jgi:hypothetical protein
MSEIPAVSKLRKKEKAAVLIAALERWNAHVASGEFPQRNPSHPDAVEESRKLSRTGRMRRWDTNIQNRNLWRQIIVEHLYNWNTHCIVYN